MSADTRQARIAAACTAFDGIYGKGAHNVCVDGPVFRAAMGAALDAADVAAPAVGVTVEQLNDLATTILDALDGGPFHPSNRWANIRWALKSLKQPEPGTHDVCATCNGTGWVPEDEFFDNACPDCTDDAGVEP